MSPKWEYVWGKLPLCSSVPGSRSSEESPSPLWSARSRSNSSRASSTRPRTASASTSQNVQTVNAALVSPKSSGAV
jgi:hypothetical protein